MREVNCEVQILEWNSQEKDLTIYIKYHQLQKKSHFNLVAII